MAACCAASACCCGARARCRSPTGTGGACPFTPPFRLFLFANMLFFAMQSMTSSSIVSETLALASARAGLEPPGAAAGRPAAGGAGNHPDLYAPVFDHAVTLNAKSLIILMVLPFTLTLALTFRRNRPPFGAHAAFALHFYAFLLLLFCALLAIAALEVRLGGSGMPDLDKPLFLAYARRQRGLPVPRHGGRLPVARRHWIWQGGDPHAGRRRHDLRLPLRGLPDHALYRLTPRRERRQGPQIFDLHHPAQALGRLHQGRQARRDDGRTGRRQPAQPHRQARGAGAGAVSPRAGRKPE